MNKLAMGIGAIATGLAVKAGARALELRYPDQMERVRYSASGLRDLVLEFSEVDLNRPMSLLKPLLGGETKSNRGLTRAGDDGIARHVRQVPIMMKERGQPVTLVSRFLTMSGAGIRSDLFRTRYGQMEDDELDLDPGKVIELGIASDFFIVQGAGRMKGALLLVRGNPSRRDNSLYGASIPVALYVNDEMLAEFSTIMPAMLTADLIRQLFWPKERCMRANVVSNITAYGGVDGDTPAPVAQSTSWSVQMDSHGSVEYVGPAASLMDVWDKMVSEDRPFNVMLFGPPGTGKTSIFKNWVSTRKLCVITVNALDLVHGSIDELMFVAPHVIMVEDIDRLGHEDVSKIMWIFEHSWQEHARYPGYSSWKPMIFTSCNHPDKLPDALWRPGRLDQMVLVSTPPESMWLELVQRMALRIGLTQTLDEIGPEDTIYEACAAILRKNSPAHMEQYLLRLKLLGRNYKTHQQDQTFDPPVRWNGGV